MHNYHPMCRDFQWIHHNKNVAQAQNLLCILREIAAGNALQLAPSGAYTALKVSPGWEASFNTSDCADLDFVRNGKTGANCLLWTPKTPFYLLSPAILSRLRFVDCNFTLSIWDMCAFTDVFCTISYVAPNLFRVALHSNYTIHSI